jgi:alpha-beta hydrolase superfamily lysophospholipase
MPNNTVIDGGRSPIHLYSWDQPSPRYVAVIVHGYGEHAGRYEHVAQALSAAGAAVYAADYPGHGRSEGEPALVTDIDDFVADTEKVVSRARGEHAGLPLVLIGHSLGGMVATRYAQTHPGELAALVLSGPVIGGNPDIMGLVALPEIPEIPIDPGMLSRDPAVGAAYAEDPLVYHGPFKRATLEALVEAVDRISGGGPLGEMPTLWIHGEEDPLAPLTQAREAIERVRGPQLEEKIYPGAKHEIFNETNGDEVLADVSGFVDRAMTAAASANAR